MMNIISNHLLEWSLLIGFILFLTYSMFAIKNEKKSFVEETDKENLFGIHLLIPKWWSMKEENQNTKIYHRADTKYDWLGIFKVIQNNNKKLEDILDEYLKEKKIVFDSEAMVETNSTHLFKNDPFNRLNLALRVEGKASEDIINRLYLDIYLFQYKEHAYFFISRSSVLNGIVEGPFFEEMVYRSEEIT